MTEYCSATRKALFSSVKLVNEHLLVTTRIRDASGTLLAEMNDNEWKHLPQPAIFDRNYTADALEIRDGSGRVALQVANLGSTVDVSAIFHCADGWTYMAGPIGGAGSAIELRPPGQGLQWEIPAICDYPSDRAFRILSRHRTAQTHDVRDTFDPPNVCSCYAVPIIPA